MNALKAPPKWGVNIWDVFILWSLLREIKATSMKQRVFPLKTIYWHAKKNKKQIHLFPENDCCCSPLSPTALSPHSTSSIKTKIPALSVLMVLGHWQTPEWLHHNWYLFFFFLLDVTMEDFLKKMFYYHWNQFRKQNIQQSYRTNIHNSLQCRHKAVFFILERRDSRQEVFPFELLSAILTL